MGNCSSHSAQPPDVTHLLTTLRQNPPIVEAILSSEFSIPTEHLNRTGIFDSPSSIVNEVGDYQYANANGDCYQLCYQEKGTDLTYIVDNKSGKVMASEQFCDSTLTSLRLHLFFEEHYIIMDTGIILEKLQLTNLFFKLCTIGINTTIEIICPPELGIKLQNTAKELSDDNHISYGLAHDGSYQSLTGCILNIFTAAFQHPIAPTIIVKLNSSNRSFDLPLSKFGTHQIQASHIGYPCTICSRRVYIGCICHCDDIMCVSHKTSHYNHCVAGKKAHVSFAQYMLTFSDVFIGFMFSIYNYAPHQQHALLPPPAYDTIAKDHLSDISNIIDTSLLPTINTRSSFGTIAVRAQGAETDIANNNHASEHHEASTIEIGTQHHETAEIGTQAKGMRTEVTIATNGFVEMAVPPDSIIEKHDSVAHVDERIIVPPKPQVSLVKTNSMGTEKNNLRWRDGVENQSLVDYKIIEPRDKPMTMRDYRLLRQQQRHRALQSGQIL